MSQLLNHPISTHPYSLNYLPNIGGDNIVHADIDTMLGVLRQMLTTERPAVAAPDNIQKLTQQIEHTVGETITADGIGIDSALKIFVSLLAKQGVPSDHANYLAYIGASPTPSAVLMDSLLSATGMVGSGWIAGAGLIWAENQVLRWLADLVGLSEQAGGCFVTGGTAGNLSALVAARHRFRQRFPQYKQSLLLVAESAHSSIANCAALLDLTMINVACNDEGRVTAAALSAQLALLAAEGKLDNIVAIVATAGATNSGQIDDLEGIGVIAQQRGIWFHVDAAYGGAFLCVPEMQYRFNGIALADSVIIDPHKGLFAPYDCCALLYAHPMGVMPAFVQNASYLDQVNTSHEWNPMHYAFHLTRRARGVPLWFSLAIYGRDAYTRSLARILEITDTLRQRIAQHPELLLIDASSLSIILFKRRSWQPQHYSSWSEYCLEKGIAFIVPSQWQGESVIRLCIMSTRLENAQIDILLESLATYPG
ncbi:Decarboxylase, pyridoxal-dependent [Xenorhabdus nematophila ATCC 19061]|uniref:Decarboxylase, pyridoxal-dependent n=1 Tax=Xenorhabdus nematophila (strain ATCC 19061 / DSM 3370 / CCUG 14189 / LMG 1036 / NCIMB 9965 / AN6) TaxID=406817 RepID=D3VH52_XENNA|nr:pyridoxal-dependent decarboxylase [Xenorhabdus nematophila]CBJ88337.1 Decarboxylase, pyridoxal-dependent [Xenorhabdus nematophila ATCC 19061]CEK21254.1 Decarboxylase, pyridoxal-dependent [Xenorhabdus nematophila AN6/1]